MSSLRYDPVAVTLHWLIAISIILMIPLGFIMEDVPIDLRFGVINFHKSLGLTVLALSIFRFVWRLMNPPPPLPLTMTPAEKFVAVSAHWVLYFLMIAMPLTGWIMVSATQKYPIVFFGLGEAPFLPMPPDIDAKATNGLFKEFHESLAIGAAILVAGHAGAALRHHFAKKDDVLRRMLPLALQKKP